MCMVMYLQCCGAIPTCYTYISLATAACTRMGLHRSESSTHLNPIDQEVRKRVFWSLRTMATYVTTILGLPRMLSDNDIDQDLPLEVNDECITDDGIDERLSSVTCPMTTANAHMKLIRIMDTIRRNVLNPCKSGGDQSQAYMVDYARIIKAENELETWFTSLPSDSNFNKPISNDLIKCVIFLYVS